MNLEEKIKRKNEERVSEKRKRKKESFVFPYS